jgi:hypothetical protein
MQIALGMSELEFIDAVENVIKPIDSSAKIVPLSGSTSTRNTTIKTFTIGIVSPVTKREDVFIALVAFTKQYKDTVDYSGWSLNIDRSAGTATDFSMVIHTITAKLHSKKC